MLDLEPVYSSNDYIELLIRHLVRSEKTLKKATDLKLEGNDFMLSEEYSTQIYKVIVDLLLELNSTPLSIELLSMHIKRAFESKKLMDDQLDVVAEFLSFIYSGELNEEYFLTTLKDFIFYRRSIKLQLDVKEHKIDQREYARQVIAVDLQLSSAEQLDGTVTLSPFENPVYREQRTITRTGFNNLDRITQGLAPGEYAQIVGYSGGGKTAMACNIALYNAAVRVPTTVISMEADATEIAHRCYAKELTIPYGTLRAGERMLLDQRFEEEREQPIFQNLKNYLRIEDLKGKTPLNCEQLRQRMIQTFETTGHVPYVVIIDQLQFLEPVTSKKSAGPWEAEKQVAAEVDEIISHQSINGILPAVWLLHQAKGKLKRIFSREDLDGFKGIIHKADLTVGIGRENQQSQDFCIFSIKTRHCADFQLDYFGDLQYMKFEEMSGSGIAMDNYTQQTLPVVGQQAVQPIQAEEIYNGPVAPPRRQQAVQ